MVNRMQVQVREFHEKFGHPIGTAPGFQRPELRAKLIIEEAIEAAVGMVGSNAAALLVQEEQFKLTMGAPKAPNFVEAIDGIGDSLYVQFGAAIEFGVNMEPIFDEIHRSNMAKVGGATRPDGKTLKPEGWQPPRIAEMIAAQEPQP